MRKDKVTAIIVAGGSGKRMGAKIPKLSIGNRPIIIRTLEKFERSSVVDDIVVVCVGEYLEKLRRILKKYKVRKIYSIVPGGKTRQESSFIGINACPPGTGYVLIHDAVRPFVTGEAICDVLSAAKAHGAATVAAPITDTVFKVECGFVSGILERDKLAGVQTPQGFRLSVIRKAHELADRKGKKSATDDASLVFDLNAQVKIVFGDRENKKITTRKDLA
jgi:2-C-methyl-D-erythritol 4-phosphate cytidylyltransferase